MTNMIPEGPGTMKTTLLHDVIQADNSVIVIETSNEIKGNRTRHSVSQHPEKDE